MRPGRRLDASRRFRSILNRPLGVEIFVSSVSSTVCVATSPSRTRNWSPFRSTRIPEILNFWPSACTTSGGRDATACACADAICANASVARRNGVAPHHASFPLKHVFSRIEPFLAEDCLRAKGLGARAVPTLDQGLADARRAAYTEGPLLGACGRAPTCGMNNHYTTLIALLAIGRVAQGQDPTPGVDLPTDARSSITARDARYVGIPVLRSTPMLGFGLGAVGAMFGRLDSASSPSVIGVGGAYSQTRSWMFAFGSRASFHSDARRGSGALWCSGGGAEGPSLPARGAAPPAAPSSIFGMISSASASIRGMPITPS